MAGRSLYALAVFIAAVLFAVILDGVITAITISASPHDASPISWLDLTWIGLPAIVLISVLAGVSSYTAYLRSQTLNQSAGRFAAVTFVVAFASLALAGAEMATR